MSYIGDFRLGDTFDTKFCTVNTSGVPTTLAGTPVISAYVGNSTTQLTAGITLTVDFDAVTGMHHVRVVATSGNGYATASNYQLVITTGTVGGSSVVGYVVAEFSIEARSALMPTTAARTLAVNAGGDVDANVTKLLGTAWLAPGTAGTPDVNVKLWNGLTTVALPLVPTTAGRTLDVSATGEAGLDWANIGSPTTSVALSNTTVALTAAAETSAVAAVWAYTIEAGRSAAKLMKLFSSALLGKTASFVNGGTGTGTIRDVADTKNRITSTFDANGNRTAVTLDDT